MTMFYRATQRGAVEQRDSADGRDLPAGFSTDEAMIRRAAAAIEQRPAFWRDYRDWVGEGMQRPMPNRFGGDAGWGEDVPPTDDAPAEANVKRGPGRPPKASEPAAPA